MAYSKPTLADLKQSLADRHDSGDLPTDSATLSLWIRLFNRGVNYCIDRLGITQTDTITISGGTGALPDDFVSIDTVLDGEDNIFSQIPFSDADSTEKGEDLYWISGDFQTGLYLNAPDDDTLKIYYQFRANPMSSDSDVCAFPDEEAIVAYAYGMLRKSESDPFEDSFNALAEVNARLREVGSQYNQNESPLEFNLYNNA